jgi:small subunit ribosomal protein S21
LSSSAFYWLTQCAAYLCSGGQKSFVLTVPAVLCCKHEAAFLSVYSIQLIKGDILPVTVKLRSNETQQQLLRRFRKQVIRSRILSDARRKRWHISKGELRKMKKKKAIRRRRRQQRRHQSHSRRR